MPLLSRQPTRTVLVYGDDEAKTASKMIWSILGSSDIKLVNVDNFQHIIDYSSSSVLTFIVVGDNNENAEVAELLAKNPDFAGEVLGIAEHARTEQRMALLSMGFDAVFNDHMTTSPVFKNILLKKIEKGKSRQINLMMQEEYRRFRAALSASPDAFIVLDNQNRIFCVSDHYRRAYPEIAEYLVPETPILDVFKMGSRREGVTEDHPQYAALHKFWHTLRGHVDYTMKDGRTWRIKAAPLAEGQGSIITTTDVTNLLAQKKEIEEKSARLAEALQAEQEASNLQKQFIGMVSHEFRTPLAIIDGHAQMLQRPGRIDAEQVRSRSNAILSAVSRLVNMMESVLSSNMLKTGRMDPDPANFDLGQLLADLCREQQDLFRPDTIFCDVSGLKNPVHLDRKMMILIVTNLLSNAVKFSSAHPRIEVNATQSGDDIVISIADNGIGIPEGELGKIFDQYYRASTSNGIPGTGIGLYLVQSLVKLQNGRITVQSQVDLGTVFTIYLRNLN